MQTGTENRIKKQASSYLRGLRSAWSRGEVLVTLLSVHTATGGSMKELADKSGISEQHLSDLKRGRRDMSEGVAEKLAKI
jgi:transcriptional regulator with XRE-family HTH domain